MIDSFTLPLPKFEIFTIPTLFFRCFFFLPTHSTFKFNDNSRSNLMQSYLSLANYPERSRTRKHEAQSKGASARDIHGAARGRRVYFSGRYIKLAPYHPGCKNSLIINSHLFWSKQTCASVSLSYIHGTTGTRSPRNHVCFMGRYATRYFN